MATQVILHKGNYTISKAPATKVCFTYSVHCHKTGHHMLTNRPLAIMGAY